ncbi:hypothetical protein STRAU_1076 [Streptomyces aurantiacus JA 4570]|uniref:Uncharacterized protein n=1 Tax=Streptomyces aurantiacus JA 4570 TaxID=1286094 RepID=S4A552_9ACTN|nr:hypothetical protein STRAU_1076 [Streptomyces aurantiacus JA 4570]
MFRPFLRRTPGLSLRDSPGHPCAARPGRHGAPRPGLPASGRRQGLRKVTKMYRAYRTSTFPRAAPVG